MSRKSTRTSLRISGCLRKRNEYRLRACLLTRYGLGDILLANGNRCLLTSSQSCAEAQMGFVGRQLFLRVAGAVILYGGDIYERKSF